MTTLWDVRLRRSHRYGGFRLAGARHATLLVLRLGVPQMRLGQRQGVFLGVELPLGLRLFNEP